MPDGRGHMHLVDIRSSDNQEEIAPLFNAFNDIVFRLFTRSNPTTPQVIQINNHGHLANSNFNVNHQTRIHIHGKILKFCTFNSIYKSIVRFLKSGWQGGGHDNTGSVIRNAYINRGDFNVFTVDWGVGAGTVNYLLARNRVNEVGHVVAQFIDFLNVYGLPHSRVGLTGHSLGEYNFARSCLVLRLIS